MLLAWLLAAVPLPARSRPAADWCTRVAARAERLAGGRESSGWLVELLRPERCLSHQGAEFTVRAHTRAQLSDSGVELLLEQTLTLESGDGRRADSLDANLARLLSRAGKLVAWLRQQKPARRFAERYGPLGGKVLMAAGSGQVLLTGGRMAPLGRRPYLLLASGSRDAVRAYAVAGSAGLPVRRELLRLAEAVSDHHPGCRVVWAEGRALPRRAGDETESDGGDGNDGGVAAPCPGDDEDCIPDRWLVRGALAGPACPAAITVEVSERLLVGNYHAWQKQEQAGWQGVPR